MRALAQRMGAMMCVAVLALPHPTPQLPGFSAPERNIEVVHVERAWYSHVRRAKGRMETELLMGVPEDSKRGNE